MFRINKAAGLIQQLKCAQCAKILSVFPIYHCSATGNICGRCCSSVDWMISNGTVERATAYEAVAKHLIFPCINQEHGCNAELTWNRVESHEKSCSLKVGECPLNCTTGVDEIRCEWRGILEKIPSHMHEAHPNHNKTSFVVNVNENNTNMFFTNTYENTFLILTQYNVELNKFYCGVMCLAKAPENQFFRYELRLGKGEDYILILRKSCTEEFVNKAELLKNHENFLLVDVGSVKTMFDDLNCLIHCQIAIVKKNKKEISLLMDKLKLPSGSMGESGTAEDELKTKSSENPDVKKNVAIYVNVPFASAQTQKKLPELLKVDKQLLDELECPVCTFYMVPPIYICVTGHSICLNCKDKVKDCPTCHSLINNTRNFTLEKLTTRVTYPCKNAASGCKEICISTNIHKHEQVCIYDRNICPLKLLPKGCNHKTTSDDVVSHIHQCHAELLLMSNLNYTRNLKSALATTFAVAIHENQVFIICMKHSATNGPLKFNVLHVGMARNQPKFRYELMFVDQINKGASKVVVANPCQVLPVNIGNALKNCLAIPLEMLNPFVVNTETEHSLYFKFLIKKL